MPNAENLNKFLAALPSLERGPVALEADFTKRFTVRLGSDTLIERGSIEGRLTEGARSWLQIDPAQGRLKEVFESSVDGCPAEAAERISPQCHRELVRLKSTRAQEEEAGPVDRLQEILQREAPALAEEALHWSQNEEEMRALSLLSERAPSDEPIDPMFVDALFSGSLEISDTKVLNRFIAFINRYREALGVSLEPFDEEFQDALRRKTEIESIRDKAGEFSREPRLLQAAQELATNIRNLPEGQRRLIIGTVPAREATLWAHIAMKTDLANLFNPGYAEDLARKIKDSVQKTIQTQVGAESQRELEKILSSGLAKYLLPSLFTSFFQNRSLGGKILVAPLELLRFLAAESVHSIFQSMSDSLARGFFSFLGEEGLRELRASAASGTLDEYLARKLGDFLGNNIELISRDFRLSLINLRNLFPAQMNTLLGLLGYGDLGEPEQQIWFEVEKSAEGKLTLSVFAGGEAASNLPSIAGNDGPAHPVLVQYRDLDPAKLDTEFFYSIFQYDLAGVNEQSYSKSDLYTGLLRSLGAPAADLRADPAAYSCRGAKYKGMWGSLHAFLHYRLKWSDREEDAFLFRLQKEAFLDAVKGALDDPASLRRQCRNGEALLQNALERHRQGLCTLDELKRLYATVVEVFNAAREPNCERGKRELLVPPQMADRLRVFLSSIAPDALGLVKELLISSGGPQMQAAISSIERQFPPPPPAVEVPMLQRSKEFANAALQIALGITLQDVTKPNFWSVVRLSILVTRVVTIILFPHLLSLNLSMIALAILKQSAYFFFPHHVALPNRLKYRLDGQFIGRILLTKDLREQYDAIIREWRAVATRSGVASYEIAGKPSIPKIQRLEKRIFTGPSSIVAFKDRSQFRDLRASEDRLKPENAHQIIDSWLAATQIHEQGVYIHPCSTVFLNEQIRSLPMPLPGAMDDLWARVEAVDKTLDSLSRLAFSYYQHLTISDHSAHLKKAGVIHLFKLYAIIDKLARRCPEARLTGFTPNGWVLSNWNHRATFWLGDRALREELQGLQLYFGVDPQRDAQLDHDSERISQARNNCLFFPQHDMELTSSPAHSNATERYLRQFLERPEIIAKLRIHGIEPDDPYVDRIAFLFADPTLPLSAWIEPSPELAALFSSDPRRGVLPYSFFILRRTHVLAQTYAEAFLNAVFDEYHGSGTLSALPVISLANGLVKIKERDNYVRRGINFVTLGLACRGIGPSSLDRIPKARYVESEVFGTQCAWRPLDQVATLWSRNLGLLNLSLVGTSILQSTARPQNKIANQVAGFDRVSQPRSASWFMQWIQRLSGPNILLNVLSKLSPAERRVIEMIRSDPEDAAVRTLSYFNDKIELLKHKNYLILLRFFLLQGNTLYPYLAAHPEFSKTLGTFFKRAVESYLQPGQEDVCLELIEIALLAKADANAAVDGLGDRTFPCFRNILCSLQQKNEFIGKASRLHLLFWLMTEPTDRLAEAAASDLVASAVIFSSRTNPKQIESLPSDFKAIHVEFLSKWQTILERWFDRETSRRDELLNSLASRFRLTQGNTLQWEGSFPNYTAGGLAIQLGSALPIHSDQTRLKYSIRFELHEALDQECIEQMGPLTRGSYPIGESMGAELIHTRGDHLHKFAFYKIHHGEKYYWTGEKSEQGYTLWKGENRGAPEALLLDRKGNIQKILPLQVQPDGSFAILPHFIMVDGERCDEINLSLQNPNLGFLFWFQPLTTIRAYRGQKDPSRIRAFTLEKLGLDFQVEGGVARGQGVLSGLTIAQQQRQEDRYPTLNLLTRYLLLNNDRGDVKVLLPSDTLFSAAANWVLKGRGVQTTQMADCCLDLVLPEQIRSYQQQKFYLYDLDDQGYLTSRDPDAMIHLLSHHLAQRSTLDVRNDLLQIEALGKRKPFSASFMKLHEKLQIAGLSLRDPEISAILLRLNAIVEENRLLQQTTTTKDLLQEHILPWIFLQAHYSIYLDNPSRCAPVALDEFQELVIVNAIARHSIAFSESAIGKLDFFGDTLRKMGSQFVAESILMLPSIAIRYDQLTTKYSAPEERRAIQVRSMLRRVAMGSSEGLLSALRQDGSGGPKQVEGSILPSLIYNAVSFAKIAKELSVLPFDEVDLNASWETVHVSASDITEVDFANFLHIYYQFAFNHYPPDLAADEEKFARYQAKRAEFIRTLHLMKGRKIGNHEIDRWIEIFRTMAFDGNRPDETFPRLNDFLTVRDLLDMRRSVAEERLNGDLRSAVLTRTIATLASSFDLFSMAQAWITGGVASRISAVRAAMRLASPASLTRAAGGFSLSRHFAARLSANTRPGTPLSLLTSAAQIAPLGALAIQGLESLGGLLSAPPALPPSNPASAPIPPALIDSLHALDGELSAATASILERSCDRRLEPAEQRNLAPFDAESNDRLMQKYFGRLNESIREYQELPAEEPALYRPKSIEALYRMGSDLRKAKGALENHARELQREILKFAKKRRDLDTPDVFALPILIGDLGNSSVLLDDELFFREMVQAVGKGDWEWFAKRTKLKPEQRAALEEKVYRYLIHATRLHQLERALRIWEAAEKFNDLEHPEAVILLRQLGFEMTRKRAYQIDPASPKWALSCLLFEWGTKTMLWEKQAAQIARMLLSPNSRLVVELITGVGKTFFGIPMIAYYGDREKSIYNCFPDSLAAGCVEQTSQTSQQAFGQSANAIAITRTKQLGRPQLDALLLAHLRALHRGEHFNGRKKDLQALELRFIEEVYQYIAKPSSERRENLIGYMRLLGHIRRHCRANVDEAHQLFRRNEELNHPLGSKRRVEDPHVTAILECARHLIASPEIAALIGLQNESVEIIDESTYHQTIKPLLAARMCSYRPFEITEDQRGEFTRYLCGQSAEVPSFVLNHPKKQEIGLVVDVLNKLLPNALGCKLFVDYGPSKCGNGGYAIPYEGNDCPMENSTIKNPFEAILKTGLMLLHTGLSWEQIYAFSEKLREVASAEARKKSIPINQTSIARAFAQWCGNETELMDFLTHPFNPRHRQLLNQSPAAILGYVKLCIAPKIVYFSGNLRSDSQNFASMFPSFFSDTATPSRNGTFPVGTTVLWDPGTAGSFVDFVCSTSDRPNAIVEIQQQNPKQALSEILERLFHAPSKASALIDSGALFRGVNNNTVAQKMLAFIEQHRPDLKGVAFYDARQNLVVWEKGASEPIPFHQSTLKPEQRLTYLDQSHTFGADVKQPIGAIGVVTLEATSTLEEFTQAGGRMRGLRNADQRLTVVVNRKVKQLISGNEPLTMRAIVSFTEKNEAASQGMENYLAARAMIFNIVRRAILDEMIFASTVPKMIQIYNAFHTVLIDQVFQTPFDMYGHPEEWICPRQALDALKEAQYQLFASSPLFSSEARQAVKAQLDEVGREDIYPDRILMYKSGQRGRSADLGVAQEVAQDQMQQVEVQVQQDMELEQDVHMESVEEPATTPLREKPVEWDPAIEYFRDLRWLEIVPIDRDVNHDKPTLYSVSDAIDSYSRPLANAFRLRLFMTNNFIGICVGGSLATPLPRMRKPVLELLLIRNILPNGSSEIISIAVDQYEANMWRNQFKLDRQKKKAASPNIQIALFDLGLQTVVDTGSNPLTDDALYENPDFRQDLIRWKFLASQPHFQCSGNSERTKQLYEAGTLWIRASNRNFMRNEFKNLYGHSGWARYLDSSMATLLEPEVEELV